jgi:hypothetical protein
MKKTFILFMTVLFIIQTQSHAQLTPPPAVNTPMSNVPSSELFKEKRTYYFWNDSYMIDGRQVLGFPFLFHEWENGSITTADGRVFPGYKLKYNVYDQTVYFSNGGDSLEVNDEIREFTITNHYPDTTITSKFVNANQYRKEKKVFYYEVIIDSDYGQLLKYNKKLVKESAEGIPAYEGKKIFRLEQSFYYYDKKKQTITAIKANGSNIKSITEPVAGVNAESYDFAVDTDIISFFNSYFDALKSK